MTDQDIQDAFLEQLVEDRLQIETAWKALRSSKVWEEKDRIALIRASHRLAGSALTVGYTRMGNAARLLETHLRRSAFQDQASLENLVSVLFIEMDAHAYDEVDGQRYVAQLARNTPSLHEVRSASLIYLVDDDPVLSVALASQVKHFGYGVRTFTGLEELRGALRHEIPAAILMDVMFPEGELAGIEAIRTLQAEHGDRIPVFLEYKTTASGSE